ncbi:hypothetical protein E2C01_056457 [Portunus trituberculatus]|uniref:Uncharacterized protein n=1 Tax=Portunus trituberculatus TaxID=210409 RepID=A0A5B7GXH1_PORTR|nr:hypothetical protein [Portunus trituberculatus]
MTDIRVKQKLSIYKLMVPRRPYTHPPTRSTRRELSGVPISQQCKLVRGCSSSLPNTELNLPYPPHPPHHCPSLPHSPRSRSSSPQYITAPSTSPSRTSPYNRSFPTSPARPPPCPRPALWLRSGGGWRAGSGEAGV